MKKLLLLSVLCVPALLIAHCGNCPGDRCQACMDKNFAACDCTESCLCKKVNCGCLGMGCCDTHGAKKMCAACAKGDCAQCACGEKCTCAKDKCACMGMECCKKSSCKNPMSEEIQAVKGGEFRIELPSHPSTGYTWEFKKPVSEKFLKLKNTYNVAQQGGLVGAPGKIVYVFEALKPGKAYIKLHEIRTWEKDGKPSDERLYKVIIRRK